ncbi:hypothetical protein CFB89_17075 [Burkholderia sp. AU16741]|nr:hypothetical protein CFB89_17075 [Burkholderia sp. AU16741]
MAHAADFDHRQAVRISTISRRAASHEATCWDAMDRSRRMRLRIGERLWRVGSARSHVAHAYRPNSFIEMCAEESGRHCRALLRGLLAFVKKS